MLRNKKEYWITPASTVSSRVLQIDILCTNLVRDKTNFDAHSPFFNERQKKRLHIGSVLFY
jgi:hypothetical protein